MWDDTYKSRYRQDVPLAVHGYRCTADTICSVFDNVTIREPKFVEKVWEMSVHPHNHGEFEILCVLEGRAFFRIDNKAVTAEKGDILLINPCQIHSASPDRSEPVYRDICINFAPDFINLSTPYRRPRTENSSDNPPEKQTAPAYYRTVMHIPASPLAGQIRIQMEEIIDAYRQGGHGWEYECKGRLYLLFSMLMADGMVWIEENERGKEDSFLADVSAYVDAHLCETFRIEEVAAHFSYSTAYFCRIFKKSFACTFTEYVNRQRISSAKMMFDRGAKSISEVADAVGMNNYSYFSRLFREQVGVLPSDYQKRITVPG